MVHMQLNYFKVKELEKKILTIIRRLNFNCKDVHFGRLLSKFCHEVINFVKSTCKGNLDYVLTISESSCAGTKTRPLFTR